MFKWLTQLGERGSQEVVPAPEPRVPAGRLSLAGAKAVSQRYFALHEQIQTAQKARDYPQVARLARQTYQLLPGFVAACKREYGRWDIQSSVAVHGRHDPGGASGRGWSPPPPADVGGRR